MLCLKNKLKKNRNTYITCGSQRYRTQLLTTTLNWILKFGVYPTS